MATYTIIFFYSNGDTDTYEADSIISVMAIESGVLKSWYEMSMTFPNITRKNYLTGMVIINNKRHDVIENINYIERKIKQCQDLN